MFADWAEFQKLIGATWGKGTGHGARHFFEVKITDPNHPITQGMTSFTTLDELWHRMVAQPEKKVLATAFSDKEKGGSGSDEPMVIVTEFGKGRCFNLVLGHDVTAMDIPGFQMLLARGTEWAATGKVTIPASALPTTEQMDTALKAMDGYRFGDSREAMVSVERMVSAVSADAASKRTLASKLAASLASDATIEAKQFVCKQLSVIGGAPEVPALAKLLPDKDLAFYARFALERIPGEEAPAAMRAALETTSGAVRIGLINSLAARRDAKAVPQITKAITGTDDETAAAIEALGQIGGGESVRALSAVETAVSAKLRAPLSRAMLRCAEGLLSAGQVADAASIFEKLSDPEQPAYIRAASFPGYVACAGDKGNELVLAALSGNDRAMQGAALRALRDSKDAALMRAVILRLDGLPADLQAQVIALLGERGELAALPAVTKATGSQDATVKRAALAALGSLGNASSVSVLADRVEGASDEEKKIILDSLSRLRGEGVDEAIIAALKKSAPAAQRELIRALVARGVRSAVPALFASAESSDPQVRREAVSALGKLGDTAVCDRLIQMLDSAAAPDRGVLESALAAICRRQGASDPILNFLPKSTVPQKVSLLGVLSTLGGDAELQAVRGAVKAALRGPQGGPEQGRRAEDAEVRTAAVKALADWPDAAPLDDLLSLAATTDDAKSNVFALRGVARLAPLAKDRPPDKLLALLTEAMTKANRTEERKALLSALGAIPTLGAMKVAEANLKDPALADEAAMAVVQIAEAIWQSHRAETRQALKQFVETTQNPAVSERAATILLKLDAPKNLSLGATATSPDGLESDGAASGDQAAIDGNPATYWDEADGQKLYILRVQLKQPATVSAIRITGYQHHNYAPKDFDILCDDKVVKKVANAQYQNNLLTILLPPTQCAVVELKITGYYGRSPAIREIEIFGENPAVPKQGQ
jgi:HEAT repeat protein